jgi:hypothetical protein
MTTLRVTAKCPMCSWTLSELLLEDLEPIKIIRKFESKIDQFLLNHTKSHDSVRLFLEKAGAVPSQIDNKFRGSYNLMYKEESL